MGERQSTEEQCPSCGKSYNEGVKAAYKLGLLGGQNRFKHSLNILQKTCEQLGNELIWLDAHYPLVDAHNVVAIPLATFRRLLELLQSKSSKIDVKKKLYFRKRLQVLLEKQRGGLSEVDGVDILADY